MLMSALLWRGTPYRLLDALRQQPGTQLYSSAALLEELADVLTRASASKQLALINQTANQALADYLTIIELAEPISVPRVVSNDPDDDHVLACGLAAKADLIVSGDRKHLLPLGSYQGIHIVNAAEALRRLAAV
jgi:putative PIN family toxin of toxin-antitoxin system